MYVDYLATAPWNYAPFLAHLGSTPRFRRSGEVLLQAAIALGRELGWEGRIGLYALPQAESFCTRLGLTALGVDDSDESLQYFERTPEQPG